ncbi:hypothetical protein [Mucilaginibacter polytrichastri]|uniref:Uncharacterized protein n=1 Tax=Mucilaginibacter polytrichastri TaxID=1302689 RepID=A0A1Q6A417_9SPHI|nr:hypothetical protein [Mucilaginibacter polytrichastri]OKS88759.1 hypothetical protein RG47T_4237 [Mucilaginibacter polytrichastri]SFT05325.1 hypothetical protein SAMN04487890_10992 [Mucilaginibacter polytrichastri]
MNLLESIIHYYNGEVRHGFYGALLGGLLLIAGALLWKWAGPLSLLKGLSWPMVLIGLLVGIGGAASSFVTRKAIPARVEQYRKDPATFLEQESVKVEKTHKSWSGIRLFWGILSFGGLILSLTIGRPFWLGVGLGTLASGILLSVFEHYSMKFNEQYYQQVTTAASSNAVLNQPVNRPAKQFMQVIAKPPVVIERTLVPNDPDTTQCSINQADDSLNSRSLATIIPGTTTVASNTVIPDTPAILTGALDIISIPQSKRKRKLLDYYNSDLIKDGGISAKRCWFRKKYIKE